MTHRHVLGARIKELREKLHLSRREFAKRTGFSYTIHSQWERDESTPLLTSVDKMADVLGTSREYLLGEIDTPVKRGPLSILTRAKAELADELGLPYDKIKLTFSIEE